MLSLLRCCPWLARVTETNPAWPVTRRILMSPIAPDSSPIPALESSPGAGVQAVGALNRFLGALVEEAWEDLDRALRITESVPDFSGILPLGDPSLFSYLDRPGVFFILGPQPRLPLLHIGASRGPVGPVLLSRLERLSDGTWVWRWERRSDPPPTFAAVATMMDHWAFAPPLRDLLARRLDFEGAGPCATGAEIPRVERREGGGAGEDRPT
jgi:hypothetical protein